MRSLCAIVLAFLLILLAIVVATGGLAAAGPAMLSWNTAGWAARGGDERAGDPCPVFPERMAARGGDERAAPSNYMTARVCNNKTSDHTGACKHALGDAMYQYARKLDPRVDGIGMPHQVLPRRLGGASAEDTVKKPLKPWTHYETWEALIQDEGALAEYIIQRAAVLSNPDLDWGPVLAIMRPKLKENREYIGIVNLDADGRTLRLVASEPSPIEAGTMGEDSTSFAGVPSELVGKYAKRPGLFIFHTHPEDPRAWPLPSSQDLSVAIYFSAGGRFAASAVISSYGVLVYGPDTSAINAIHQAKDIKLAMLNLSHDVVAAHEATRSWSAHTIADYLGFYPRHRMLMFVYPSSKMVGDSRRYSLFWDLESPIDHEMITEHATDIAKHCTEVNKMITRSSLSANLIDDIGPSIKFD